MDWIQAFILGIVQGLTEFLPISSSGHLVLAQHFLGIETPGVLLEVILHMGTLVAILIYFYDDIGQLFQSAVKDQENSRKYIMHLVIATIPAVCIGLFFQDIIETTFTPSIVKWMLLVTGLVVGSTYFFQNRPRRELVAITALCIGFAQAFAVLPGISRSGVTISLALMIGVQHEKAAKFAFFMAIPVLLGAGLLQLFTIDCQATIYFMPLFVGFLSSALTGYLVINWFLAVISIGKFYLFSLYCLMVSMLSFIMIK